MEKMYAIVFMILWLIWTIVCFIAYHKIFSVYYFSLFYGLVKEIFFCSFAGALLSGLTIMISTPLAIGIIIVGFIVSRNLDSTFARNACFAICVLLALIIFLSGRWYKNIASSEKEHNDIEIIQNEDTYEQSLDEPVVISTEPGLQVYSEATTETEGTIYVPEETYVQPTYKEYTNSYTTRDVNIRGVVLESSGGLNIRSGPGTHYDEVGRLAPNEKVTVLELTQGISPEWGRIDRGWVCMDYIVDDNNHSTTSVQRVGYITGSTDGVNVRSGPSISYDMVGKVYLGQQVNVTEICHNGVSEWANIGYGWVCTDYVSWNTSTAENNNNTPIVNNTVPIEPIRDELGREFVGYDCQGRELYVGYTVRIGTQYGSTEYAVGTISACLGGYLPVVEFTEIYDDNGLTGDILYCQEGLADRIRENGSYCCSVESQYLEIYVWG